MYGHDDCERELRVQRDQNSILRCDIERLQSKVGHLDSQIEQLKADVSGAQESLLRSNAIRDELEQARENTAQELQDLKDAIARTLIKLPGGHEVTVQEAQGIVLAHEKIQS